MSKIKIDIVSDVVCPWCYIGKRRLEKAMAQVSDKIEFEINYLPFELNPDMPKEGKSQKEHLTRKFGGEEKYKQLTTHVGNVAAQEGLRFNFDEQTTTPNTRDAHRIIWFAKEEGKQIEVKEAFLKAFFENGIDLTKRENLIDVAANAGLASARIAQLLDSDEGEAEVAYIERINQQRGVTGVPFYIINDKYGVSGAQPPEAFLEIFAEVNSAISGKV